MKWREASYMLSLWRAKLTRPDGSEASCFILSYTWEFFWRDITMGWIAFNLFKLGGKLIS